MLEPGIENLKVSNRVAVPRQNPGWARETLRNSASPARGPLHNIPLFDDATFAQQFYLDTKHRAEH
jgi:hypothetical protein